MKISKIIRKIITASVAASVLILSSCSQLDVREESDSFVPGNVSDIMNRSAIKEMAFMGGSVLYSPKNPSANQVAKDVVIAVRQGKVEKTYLGSDMYAYKNSEKNYTLGYLKINEVSKENISFTYYVFDDEGYTSCKGDFTVSAGSSVDLNSDGTPDISWRKPDAGRSGVKNDMWLEFLCDMEKGDSATMFSIVPEQYERSAYPNGLIGINSDGRFVVSKYEVGGSSRSAVSVISYGDYVFDMQNNTVNQYVGEARNGRSAARAIEDSELVVNQVSTSSNPEEFEFKANEFAQDFDIKNLLSKMPSSIVQEDYSSMTIVQAVAYLNSLIREPSFIEKLVAANSGDAVEEIKEQLNQGPVTDMLERVLFNRHSLSLIYPEDCPDVNIGGMSLGNALPWFYVELGENDLDELNEINSRAAISAYNCSGELEAKYNSKVAQLKKKAEEKYKDQHGVYEEGYIDYEIKRDVITGYFDTLKSVNIATFAAAFSGQQWLADLVTGSDGQLRIGVDGSIGFANLNPSINLKVGVLLKIEMQNRIAMNVHSVSMFSSNEPETETLDKAKEAFDKKYPDAKLNKDELKEWMDSMNEKDLREGKGVDKGFFKFDENGPAVTTDGTVRPSEDAKKYHKALQPVKVLPFVITFDAKFDILFDINAVIELNDVVVGGVFMNVFEVKAGIDWGFRKKICGLPRLSSFYANAYAGGARFTDSTGYIGFTKINRDEARVGGGVQFVVTPVFEARVGVGLGYDIGVASADATIGAAVDFYAPLGLFVGLTFKPDWTPVFTTELGMDFGISCYGNLQLCLDPPCMDPRYWTKDLPCLSWNAVKPIFRIQQENGKLVKMEGPGEWEFSGLGC